MKKLLGMSCKNYKASFNKAYYFFRDYVVSVTLYLYEKAPALFYYRMTM